MSIIGNILTIAVDRVREIQLTNGYAMDVCNVERPNRTGDYSKEHHSVVITHADPEPNDELSKTGNPPVLARDVVVNITGHIRQDITSEDPLDDLLDDFADNIAKSVTSATDWHQFGGNSINATLGSHVKNGGDDDGTCGVTVPITVTYRFKETDPTTAVS